MSIAYLIQMIFRKGHSSLTSLLSRLVSDSDFKRCLEIFSEKAMVS